ncbi:hypothetical protein CRG98_018237 [Punica granatum]|uniref:Uncharacterized protein n=1 Tax=Punica granatum TaxID=22663 RepID=A0A2I0JYH4_PUNGR|nr:hypothetical protein CRG98_018237 [Punica granatum]
MVHKPRLGDDQRVFSLFDQAQGSRALGWPTRGSWTLGMALQAKGQPDPGVYKPQVAWKPPAQNPAKSGQIKATFGFTTSIPAGKDVDVAGGRFRLPPPTTAEGYDSEDNGFELENFQMIPSAHRTSRESQALYMSFGRRKSTRRKWSMELLSR